MSSLFVPATIVPQNSKSSHFDNVTSPRHYCGNTSTPPGRRGGREGGREAGRGRERERERERENYNYYSRMPLWHKFNSSSTVQVYNNLYLKLIIYIYR